MKPLVLHKYDYVYKENIILLVSTPKRLRKFVKGVYGLDVEVPKGKDGMCRGLYGKRKSAHVVWVCDGLSPERTKAVMVHELLHASMSILSDRGVDDEEALAYYLESAVECFIPLLDDYLAKREAKHGAKKKKASGKSGANGG